MREGRAPSCSEPEGEDELLVPGVAGEHFAVEVFSRVSHRWTAAMLAINPAIGGAHDISPRREDMDGSGAHEILNDRVLPFLEEHGIVLCRVLTDRGTEYCGNPEHHDYELYLAVEDIDHTRTKTKSPQTNGICERFHRTVLDEFYRVAFRKKIYRTIDELQNDLDGWVTAYNRASEHPSVYVVEEKRLC
jgi:hypothetical protein